jgi:hypothetical protein
VKIRESMPTLLNVIFFLTLSIDDYYYLEYLKTEVDFKSSWQTKPNKNQIF